MRWKFHNYVCGEFVYCGFVSEEVCKTFSCKNIHFTLFPFTQIKDIEVIFILPCISFCNIKILLQITFSVKNHIKYYIVNLLKLFIYLHGKRILEPHQIIVRTSQSYLNTQKETITMLSMERFFVFATLLFFYFQGDSSFVTKWLTKQNFSKGIR